MTEAIPMLAKPRMRPLLLSDVGWLQRFFCRLVEPLADVNPIAVVAWRTAAHLEYLIEDNVLYVIGEDAGGKVLWLPPVGTVKLTRAHIIRGLELVSGNCAGGAIHNLWEQYPLWGEMQLDRAFSIRAASTEYQYDTWAIADLWGAGLKKKRSDVRFFIDKYQPRIARYEPSAANECVVLMRDWLAKKRRRCNAQSVAKVERECEVCTMALRERLPLEGVVCRVGSHLVAFSVGVPHSGCVFNCLFEKADLRLRGSSPFIFSALAESLRGRFTYINAGDDWEEPELAHAKRLWRPITIRQTYRLTMGNGGEPLAERRQAQSYTRRQPVDPSSYCLS